MFTFFSKMAKGCGIAYALLHRLVACASHNTVLTAIRVKPQGKKYIFKKFYQSLSSIGFPVNGSQKFGICHRWSLARCSRFSCPLRVSSTADAWRTSWITRLGYAARTAKPKKIWNFCWWERDILVCSLFIFALYFFHLCGKHIIAAVVIIYSLHNSIKWQEQNSTQIHTCCNKVFPDVIKRNCCRLDPI